MAGKKLIALGLVFLGLWLNNTSVFITPSEMNGVTKLIAHRGVHQIYTGENRTAKTCRAESIKPVKHPFIENTIPSMQAAFEYGASVVELDVHLTVDGVLAVFHDWRLECQTNGEGVTHKKIFMYLKTLDIGYGFTADGITFPFRGSTAYQLPSLTDVLETEVSGKFLVNFKGDRRADGDHLEKILLHSDYRSKLFGVYGGESPTRAVVDQVEGMKGFDRSSLKSCWLRYLAIGWTGAVPKVCRNRLLAVPLNYAPFLWGWPYKLTNRLQAVNTDLILWGPYDGTGFSSGIDDQATLTRVPDKFPGYVWTNTIEIIGPLVKNNDRF